MPLLLASALALGVALTTPGAGVQAVVWEGLRQPDSAAAVTSDALIRVQCC